MRHRHRERDSFWWVVHPVQPMSDNGGDHRVVPSIPSMMITTYAIAPLISLLGLGIALLWVDPLFWLVRSWSQLSVRKRQHLLVPNVVILVLVGWLVGLELASQG